jgi:glucokinase
MTENSTMSRPVLGVDVGGTKVAAGLVDRDGKIVAQGRNPMIATGTAEAALQAVTDAIDSLISSAAQDGIQSIGICAPDPWTPRAV